MNSYVRTVLIAPLTTRSHTVSFRIPVRHAGKDGLVLLDQIRSVDKSRLVQRSGTMDANTLRLVLNTLRDLFEE